MGKIIKETILVDQDTGEILMDRLTTGSRSGRGWVMMYSARIFHLLDNCSSASTLKVFMYLAAGQQFEDRGMVTTKTAVQEALGMTRKTCIEAFKWLKENKIICENKIAGCYEFMVNPDYINVGRDRTRRKKEWLHRIGEEVSPVGGEPASSRRGGAPPIKKTAQNKNKPRVNRTISVE